MPTRRIHTVDVFTDTPFKGNPVAVILDAEGLSETQMQAIANWTNLSETTFVLPAADLRADYTLRIFTPRAELPFAGHPTIGSACAIVAAGIVAPRDGKLIQHCAKGLIDTAVPEDWREAGLSFRLPAHSVTPAPDVAALHRALGGSTAFVHPPAIVDVGPRWAIAQLVDEATVRALTPDYAALATYDRTHGSTGLTVFAEAGQGALVVRSFAPADGIAEDPVCGSGNGAVAAYRLDHGSAVEGDSYVASQGREVGRDGRVTIRYADGGIHVGGRAVVCVEGILTA